MHHLGCLSEVLHQSEGYRCTSAASQPSRTLPWLTMVLYSEDYSKDSWECEGGAAHQMDPQREHTGGRIGDNVILKKRQGRVVIQVDFEKGTASLGFHKATCIRPLRLRSSTQVLLFRQISHKDDGIFHFTLIGLLGSKRYIFSWLSFWIYKLYTNQMFHNYRQAQLFLFF